MNRTQRIPLLALGLILSSCATPRELVHLNPGSEDVEVTSNPERTRGAEHLDSTWARFAMRSENKMEKAHTYAKNFTHRKGGNLAFLKVSKLPSTWLFVLPTIRTHVDIEAYKVEDTD